MKNNEGDLSVCCSLRAGRHAFFLITKMAGRRFELGAPNIHNKAQPDSITSPLLLSEKERQKEVLNSRVLWHAKS
jgi:hypothetical protein